MVKWPMRGKSGELESKAFQLEETIEISEHRGKCQNTKSNALGEARPRLECKAESLTIA